MCVGWVVDGCFVFKPILVFFFSPNQAFGLGLRHPAEQYESLGCLLSSTPFMSSYGFLWLPMAPRPHGFLWPHLGHETPYLIHMGQLWPLGTPWPRLAFSLVQIDQIASLCPPLSLTGPRFVLMGPDWPRLAQIGPYGPIWS